MEKNFLIILFVLTALLFFLVGFVTHIILDGGVLVYGYNQYEYQTQEQIEQKYDNTLLNTMIYNNCIEKETSMDPAITQTKLETTCNAYVQELADNSKSMSYGMDQVRNQFHYDP